MSDILKQIDDAIFPLSEILKQSPGTFLTASLRRTLLRCREEIGRLQTENKQLRGENERLKQWVHQGYKGASKPQPNPVVLSDLSEDECLLLMDADEGTRLLAGGEQIDQEAIR